MRWRQAQIFPVNDVEITWRSADRVKGGVHVSKSPLLTASVPQLTSIRSGQQESTSASRLSHRRLTTASFQAKF